MKTFADIGALRSALQDVYERCPSEPGQRLSDFAGILEQQLDFSKDDAALYASIVDSKRCRLLRSGRLERNQGIRRMDANVTGRDGSRFAQVGDRDMEVF